ARSVNPQNAPVTRAKTSFVYSLEPRARDHSALFSFPTRRCSHMFNAPHDYDAAGSQRVFHLTVRASDGTLSSTQAVTVNLTDVNDKAPAITSSGTFSIA